MSRRVLPPPPLIAPTPSKVRPAALPLIVIVVSAWAGVGPMATAVAAAARHSTARTEARRREARLSDMGVCPSRNRRLSPSTTFQHDPTDRDNDDFRRCWFARR